MTERHLVVMAAGTGGHVIPGLAVAEEMQLPPAAAAPPAKPAES